MNNHEEIISHVLNETLHIYADKQHLVSDRELDFLSEKKEKKMHKKASKEKRKQIARQMRDIRRGIHVVENTALLKTLLPPPPANNSLLMMAPQPQYHRPQKKEEEQTAVSSLFGITPFIKEEEKPQSFNSLSSLLAPPAENPASSNDWIAKKLEMARSGTTKKPSWMIEEEAEPTVEKEISRYEQLLKNLETKHSKEDEKPPQKEAEIDSWEEMRERIKKQRREKEEDEKEEEERRRRRIRRDEKDGKKEEEEEEEESRRRRRRRREKEEEEEKNEIKMVDRETFNEFKNWKEGRGKSDVDHWRGQGRKKKEKNTKKIIKWLNLAANGVEAGSAVTQGKFGNLTRNVKAALIAGEFNSSIESASKNEQVVAVLDNTWVDGAGALAAVCVETYVSNKNEESNAITKSNKDMEERLRKNRKKRAQKEAARKAKKRKKDKRKDKESKKNNQDLSNVIDGLKQMLTESQHESKELRQEAKESRQEAKELRSMIQSIMKTQQQQQQQQKKTINNQPEKFNLLHQEEQRQLEKEQQFELEKQRRQQQLEQQRKQHQLDQQRDQQREEEEMKQKLLFEQNQNKWKAQQDLMRMQEEQLLKREEKHKERMLQLSKMEQSNSKPEAVDHKVQITPVPATTISNTAVKKQKPITRFGGDNYQICDRLGSFRSMLPALGNVNSIIDIMTTDENENENKDNKDDEEEDIREGQLIIE